MIGLKNSQGNTNERKKKELQIPHWDYKGSESHDHIVWTSRKILTFQSATWTLQLAVILCHFEARGCKCVVGAMKRQEIRWPREEVQKEKKRPISVYFFYTPAFCMMPFVLPPHTLWLELSQMWLCYVNKSSHQEGNK